MWYGNIVFEHTTYVIRRTTDMKIYDTHAHLDQLDNLELALKNAQGNGIEGIVTVSMDYASCQKNLEIKNNHTSPKIYLAMGVHPSEAGKENIEESTNFIKKNQKELNAIGEIGLDFWYKWVRKDKEQKDMQRKTFRQFLEIAKEFDLPAVIHSRGTWKECFETTKEVGLKRAVFHWYSGPLDVLDLIIKKGYFVSTTPSLAYSPQSREAMVQAPIEQTLIETDCPVYFKNKETGEGFQAEPGDVLKTLKAYCDLKSIEEEKAVEIFNQNAEDFFSLN